MTMRFIDRRIHAYIDYPIAAALLVLPFVLGVGGSNPAAKWLSVVVGAAALVLTVFTDHETGLIRVVPYWLHVAVDRLVGVTFAVAPLVLGFVGLDAWYYWANAAVVLATTFVFNAATRPPAVSARPSGVAVGV